MAYDPNEPRDSRGEWTSGGGGGAGMASATAARAQAEKIANGEKPLTGLPQQPIQFKDGTYYVPGPAGWLRDAARQYMKDAGLPYHPPTDYQPVDKARAARIAQAFEDMKHDPENPQVKESYDALNHEVKAQWDALKSHGLKVEWIKPGQTDPYAENPRLAAADVSEHNHWWGFPTDMGFGSGDKEAEAAMKENPLLRDSGEVVDGKHVTYNDLFRIVHDMFGHFKEGVGFRASGEDNAWRSHAAMFSEKALPAMTSETRGQNSWVNYGPYGEANRHASAADTHYAPQKIGRLPEWVWKEGR
jgi:hypothetical protein